MIARVDHPRVRVVAHGVGCLPRLRGGECGRREREGGHATSDETSHEAKKLDGHVQVMDVRMGGWLAVEA